MLVCYSVAHSDPDDDTSVVTPGGVSELQVSRNAWEPFRAILEDAGHVPMAFSGRLPAQIRMMKAAVGGVARRFAIVSLHFNSPPMVKCKSCGEKGYAGIQCAKCASPDFVRWRFGHGCVRKRSAKSAALAQAILGRLDLALGGSLRRRQVLIPDHRFGPRQWPNNLLWRYLPAPAVLVEAGFTIDPWFSDWIQDPRNHCLYGEAVARGVIDYAVK